MILEELIDEFNFVVLNTGQPTYQIRWGGMSVLDLSIVSSNIAMKSEWRVNNDSLGSDHLPCITEICEVIKSDMATAPKWLLTKADWTGFKEYCVRTIDQDIISDDIEVFSVNITDAILKAAERNIPTTSGKGIKNI